MRNEVFNSRFSDAPWLLKENKPNITVGGAGGISSWVLLFLSRTANYEHIYLYEDDIIDSTNMAGQFFTTNQINMTKAEAIKANMLLFSDYVKVDVIGRFEEGCMVTPITISGFDNMKARKDMFEAWKALDDREIFIDGRMIFEDGQIYTVVKGNEERYEATLFNDEELEPAACSLKATTHSGAHIASLMIAILNNYLANTRFYKYPMRDIPFSYVFSFPPLLVEINV